MLHHCCSPKHLSDTDFQQLQKTHASLTSQWYLNFHHAPLPHFLSDTSTFPSLQWPPPPHFYRDTPASHHCSGPLHPTFTGIPHLPIIAVAPPPHFLSDTPPSHHCSGPLHPTFSVIPHLPIIAVAPPPHFLSDTPPSHHCSGPLHPTFSVIPQLPIIAVAPSTPLSQWYPTFPSLQYPFHPTFSAIPPPSQVSNADWGWSIHHSQPWCKLQPIHTPDRGVQVTRDMIHGVVTWARLQYKYHLYRYMDFHYKDKMVVRQSYLYNGNSSTIQTVSIQWNSHL